MNGLKNSSGHNPAADRGAEGAPPDGPLLRRGYNAGVLAGRDFRRQWRTRSIAKLEYDTGRLLLITGYWLVTIAMVAFFFDSRAAHAARTVGPGWQSFFVFVTDFGKSGYLFFFTGLTCVLAAAASGLARNRLDRVGMAVLAGRATYLFAVLLGSGIASQVLKRIGRARPKLLDEGGPFQFNPLIIKSSWASFPSGHTITAFAFAMALSYFLPKWRLPLLAVACLIGVSRVIVGAHYPSDVLAGACIGVASAVLLRRLFAARSIVFKPAGGVLVARGQGFILPSLRKFCRI